MSTTVFGIPGSPFVRKVLLALDIKRVPYALNPVIPMGDNAELQARSPLRWEQTESEDWTYGLTASVVYAF